jgi:putative PIN family toxin of toxin-antitoxin system
MARIVIDANALISAAFGGVPLDAIGKAFAVGEICVSPKIDEEIDKTIHRLGIKLGGERTRTLLALWGRLRGRCTLFEPTQVLRVCRDPKDDAYLALCVAAGADVLITGDQDLLVIDPGQTPVLPQGLKILTPRQFLDDER